MGESLTRHGCHLVGMNAEAKAIDTRKICGICINNDNIFGPSLAAVKSLKMNALINESKIIGIGVSILSLFFSCRLRRSGDELQRFF